MSNKAKYHGVGGPLTVTKDSTKTPVIGLLMEAAAELGYKVGDINGEGEDGCFTPGQVRLCSVQYRGGTEYLFFINVLLGPIFHTYLIKYTFVYLFFLFCKFLPILLNFA